MRGKWKTWVTIGAIVIFLAGVYWYFQPNTPTTDQAKISNLIHQAVEDFNDRDWDDFSELCYHPKGKAHVLDYMKGLSFMPNVSEPVLIKDISIEGDSATAVLDIDWKKLSLDGKRSVKAFFVKQEQRWLLDFPKTQVLERP